jgi:hypothetical protein
MDSVKFEVLMGVTINRLQDIAYLKTAITITDICVVDINTAHLAGISGLP